MISEIDVDVPVRTAYNQWTQFEDFPLFMGHVKEVRQLDPTHVRFRASILGVKREWDAEITEQTPDQRIAWTSVDGTSNAGVVTFHALSDDRSRVVLQLDMEPDGALETLAEKGGLVADRAKIDLRSFKEFIEQRGHETGAFRGEVERPVDRDHQARRAELWDLPVAELHERGERQGVSGWEHMSKGELVEALATQPRQT